MAIRKPVAFSAMKAAAKSLDAKILAGKYVSPPEPTVDPVSTGPVSRSGSIIDPMSLLFDTDWYRAEYQDVAAAGLDPIRHFFDDGAREGRNPNAYFVTNWYLSINADVVASNMNPFLHYLLYGAREGRQPAP